MYVYTQKALYAPRTFFTHGLICLSIQDTSVCVCVFICVYMYMYNVCVCVCMIVNMYVLGCTYGYNRLSTYLFVYVSMYVNMYVCV